MSCFALSPIPVWAERVWDTELKRYLTEQEMTMAEVFLTEEDAVKLMFPKSEHIRKELLRASNGQNPRRSRIGWKFPEDAFDVYIGETSGHIDGYAFVQNTIGKHKPMTYMVGRGLAGTGVKCGAARLSRGAWQRGANASVSTCNMKANRCWIRCASIKTSSISAARRCRCVP